MLMLCKCSGVSGVDVVYSSCYMDSGNYSMLKLAHYEPSIHLASTCFLSCHLHVIAIMYALSSTYVCAYVQLSLSIMNPVMANIDLRMYTYLLTI